MFLRMPAKLAFLFLVSVFTAFSACESAEQTTINPKLDEMAEILKSLPVHPTKTETNSKNRSLSTKAEIIRKYKSSASFEETKEFYIKTLSERGWRFVEDNEPKYKGRYRGERILYFTRDEFLLSVQYAGERGDDLGWNYAVRIAHPPDWREKVS